ncbi:amidohydrolase family protein [Candidatus Bathyarchaeota archaeon]|nr:amidohydrolase family protein [Candidatus Bathyarchaeota archaeon]
MKIIDAHTHPPVDGDLKKLAEACEKAGIVKSFICGLPEGFGRMSNDVVERAMKEYSDLAKGFGYVDLGRDPVEIVDDLYARGFVGLKFIGPPKPYDVDEYFPYYERAEQYGMVTLFHTGIVARSASDKARRVTSRNMRPVYLETIARSFPSLKIIGAHLGHPWCEEAAVVSYHNPNIFFDISGGHTLYIALTLRNRLFFDIKPSKLLFGSDAQPEGFLRCIHFWLTALPQLGLSKEQIDEVFYKNAESLLGR